VVESQVGGMSIARNAVHGFLGFVAPAAMVFASYPVLIRHLGPAAFGIYLLATALSGTMMFLDLGFSAATLRFVAQDLAAGRPKAAADVVLTSLIFYSAMGVVGGTAIAVLAPVWATIFKVDARLAADAAVVFRLAGLQFAAYLPAMVFVSIAKAAEQFDRSTMAVSLLSITTNGTAIVAVMAGAGLAGVMIAVVAANFVTLTAICIHGLRFCRARGIYLSAANPVAFRRMLGFGWVLTVNSVAGFFLYQVQKFLVGFAMGPAAVSVYQAAVVVPSKLHAAVNAATEVMFPLASAAEDRAVLRHVYLRMLGGSTLVALAGFAALAVLARPLLTLWLGAPMAVSVGPLVPVFALAYFFLALSPAPFHLINGLGRPGLNTLFYAMNAFINLGLIAVCAASGLTLARFAWAFAAANIATSIAYQAAVEVLVWRREPHLSEAPA
jgi:O-antigen/teichoic acid export membrane protein